MTIPDYSTTRSLTTERPACFDDSSGGLLTLFKTPDSDDKVAEGGLRLYGQHKISTDEKPLITVVTVVYNGAEFLEDTIRSVIEQTYDNVEYIVVDGGSADGTLEIIRKYEHAIDYWVSEPDKGIYDAMNKAIDLGIGRWISFMNAGDRFFGDDVLFNIFQKPIRYDDVQVIFGDHEVEYPTRSKIIKAGKVVNLWKGSQFCHQSAIVNLAYHKENKFNLNRKIAADFEFFYKSNQSGSTMHYIDIIVSKVGAGGVSDKKRLSSIFERFMCLDNRIYFSLYYIPLMFTESLKLLVKKLC